MDKISKFAGVFVAVAFAVAVATPASAMTSAQLADLLKGLGVSADVIAAVTAAQGGSTTPSTGGSCGSFTKDLTMGSTGAEVVALQDFLVSKGHLTIPAGVSKGYFGAMTKDALAKYQAANGITPAAGYFGPMTRAKVSAACGTTTPGGNDNNDNGGSGSLQGGAGSISDTSLLASYNNEEVGEDQEDVEVAGLEIEADESSDIELTAVRLAFAHSSTGAGSDDDLDKYASEVSIWFNDEEVARVDADAFDEDNSYTKTVSLDDGAVIDAEDTGELVVKVSGVSNLDSNNADETWTVDFVSVRFEDADGAVVTDTVTEDARTFSFESFATASDLAFKIQSGDNSVNDARVIDIDDTNETDNVDLFSFKVKVEGGSDMTLDSLPIGSTLTLVGTDTLDQIFSKLSLQVDGDEVGSENPTASTTVVFDDLDLDLSEGTYEFVLVGDIKATSSATLANGNTFSFTIGESQTTRADFDLEDENGDDVANADVTGTESTETHTVFTDGISATFSDGDSKAVAYTVDGSDNDRVELTLVFEVSNFGDDTLWIEDDATMTVASSTAEVRTAPSVTEGIGYAIQWTGTSTLPSARVTEILTSTADKGTSAFEVKAGESETFTLKVSVTNAASAGLDGSQYRALLAGIAWGDSDSATADSVYTTDLLKFETTYATVAD